MKKCSSSHGEATRWVTRLVHRISRSHNRSGAVCASGGAADGRGARCCGPEGAGESGSRCARSTMAEEGLPGGELVELLAGAHCGSPPATMIG